MLDGPLFFGASRPGGELFGWYHGPESAPRGGVVLCNPIGDDAVRAHRSLRKLGERLARAGFAVLRFDFHGTGDSAGDERLPNRVATWTEDVRLAVAELRARSGATRVSVVGVRLGATLAALVPGVDDLVMWGGYARGAAFAKSALSFYKLHKKLEPAGFAGGPQSRDDGEEVFGFLLTRETLAALEALDVRTTNNGLPKRVLLLGDGSGKPETALLEAHFQGARVETRSIPGSLQFLVEVNHKSKLPEAALDAIVSWLVNE